MVTNEVTKHCVRVDFSFLSVFFFLSLFFLRILPCRQWPCAAVELAQPAGVVLYPRTRGSSYQCSCKPTICECPYRDCSIISWLARAGWPGLAGPGWLAQAGWPGLAGPGWLAQAGWLDIQVAVKHGHMTPNYFYFLLIVLYCVCHTSHVCHTSKWRMHSACHEFWQHPCSAHHCTDGAEAQHSAHNGIQSIEHCSADCTTLYTV